MMRFMLAMLIIGASFALCSSSLFAAEVAQSEPMEYSWGTVSSVASDKIEVTEYDYDTGQDITVTYALDPKVELNVSSIDEIKVGDEVDISYAVRGESKVALVINTEKPYEEDIEEDEEDIEEGAELDVPMETPAMPPANVTTQPANNQQQ